MRAKVEDKISNEEKRAWITIRIFIVTEIRVTQLSETIRLANINIHLTAIDYSLLCVTTLGYMFGSLRLSSDMSVGNLKIRQMR
jgi:hypothetical protein